MNYGTATAERTASSYCGLRMTADEFLQILDDGYNYELIDGVVIVSPSPSPQHQRLTMEIGFQLKLYLRDNPVGDVLVETDVHFGKGPTGGDLVYKPEVVFLRTERLHDIKDKLTGAPDLVVEVISKGSRRYDTETKKGDYERFGVAEYWLIDPENKSFTFYRLQDGRFVPIEPDGDSFVSKAVPGFVLDIARLRETFKPW